MLDGHNNLVTPDPVPNSEVKLVMFAFVLSTMGTREAVCFFENFSGEKFFVKIHTGFYFQTAYRLCRRRFDLSEGNLF